MKRTIVLVTILALIILTAGGAFMWYRSNSGARLLQRARLALQANNPAKARMLADSYISQNPNDWQGYYLQSRAYSVEGQFPQAYAALDKAAQADPSQVAVKFLRSDLLSRQALKAVETNDLAELRKAVGLFDEAMTILTGLQTDSSPVILERRAKLGMSYKRVSVLFEKIAQLASRQAATQEARRPSRFHPAWDSLSGDDEVGRHLRQLAAEALRMASTSRSWTSAERSAAGERLSALLAGDGLDPAFVRQALIVDGWLKFAGVFSQAARQGRQAMLAELAPAVAQAESALDEDPLEPKALALRATIAQAQRGVALRQAQQELLVVLQTDAKRVQRAAIQEAVDLCLSLGDHDAIAEARSALKPLEDAPVEAAILLVEDDLRRVRQRHAPGPIQRAHLEPIHTMLSEILERNPEDTRVKMMLADVSGRLSKYDQVKQLCDAVMESEANSWAAKYARLLLLERRVATEAPAAAESAFYKYTADNPNSPEGLYAYANAILAGGKIDQAKDVFQTLNRLGLGTPVTPVLSTRGKLMLNIQMLLDRAELAVRVGLPDAAMQLCDEVRRMSPDYARSTVIRAWAACEANPDVPMALSSFVLVANGSDYQDVARARTVAFVEKIDALIAEIVAKAQSAREAAGSIGATSMADIVAKIGDDTLDEADRQAAQTVAGKYRDVLTQYQRCLVMLRTVYGAHTIMGDTASAESVAAKIAAMPRVDQADRLAVVRTLGMIGHADAAESVLTAEIEGDQADASGRVRLTLANSLAGRGQVDKAVELLDGMAGEDALRDVALLTKANLLARAGRMDQAGEAIAALDAESRPQQAQLLVRVAQFYANANQGDKLIAAVEALVANLSDNVDLTGRVLGLIERVSPPAKAQQLCLDAAVALRNTLNAAVAYKTLAELRDAQQDRVGALAAMNDLRNLPAPSEIAGIYRAEAMFQEGRMLARWGLFDPAIERLESLAQSGQQGIPRGLLALGQALASHGRTAQAKEVLGRIGRDAPEFKQARLELVNLLDQDAAKLSALRKISQHWPADEAILYRIMTVLVRLNRPQEAVDMYGEFVRRLGDAYRPVTAAPQLTLMLMTEQGDWTAAAAEAVRLARATQANSWRVAAALLNATRNPATAKALLEDTWKQHADVPGSAAMLIALTGLATAVDSDDSILADEWAQRIKAIETTLAGSSPAVLDAMAADRLLGATADGQAGRIKELLAKVADVQGYGPTPAKALAAMADGPDRRRVAADLLLASIARQVQMPWLAYAKAMDLLGRRSDCQWAAALAYRSVGNDAKRAQRLERLNRAMDASEFGSNVVSEVARALELVVAGQDADAAAVYANLADTYGDSNHRLEQAMALERAGRTDEALDLYETLWRDNPIAANNLAFRLLADGDADSEQLTRASERAEAAVAVRGEPAFRDTLGWIAFLQGQYGKASRELTLAVRGLPREPSIHYHLGMAEAAAGNVQLAKWHFQASVNLGKTAEADNVPLDKDSVHAIARAKAELARLEGQM